MQGQLTNDMCNSFVEYGVCVLEELLHRQTRSFRSKRARRVTGSVPTKPGKFPYLVLLKVLDHSLQLRLISGVGPAFKQGPAV